MSEVDSIVLRDQMVAQEGVLKYEDGKRKLKKWANLKKFIGDKTPVINEHPPGKMKRDIDRVYAVPNLKQCEDGTKGLCADIEGDDDMPNKRGYSIGFKFHEIEQPGIWVAPDGSHHPYDSIQELTSINHIALTNMPRNNTAIRVGGDSEGPECEFFGCDAYTFTKPEVKPEVTICPKLVEKMRSDIDAVREPNYELLEAIDAAKHVEQDTVYSAGDTIQSTSVKDCVGKMISHLFKAHPKRWDPKNEAHRKQVTAVAFKKCREKHGGDAGDAEVNAWFKKCVAGVKESGGARDPEAVCAEKGREKFGKERFQRAAAAGRKAADAKKGEKIKPGSLKGGAEEPFPGKKGTGERFKACVAANQDKDDPEAFCAALGRAKFGKKGMAKMAAAGRKKGGDANDLAEEVLRNVTYAADAKIIRVKSYLRGGKRVKAHTRREAGAGTPEEAIQKLLESMTEEERRRSEVIMKQLAIATAMAGTEKFPPTEEDPFKAAGLKRVMPKKRK